METECIVCFSEYDEEEHRPRALACGHTLCTECLEKSIRETNKACPKCRKVYIASNVGDISINFTLEGVMRLLKTTKTAKENAELQLSVTTPDKVPKCVDHQLPVSHRCTTHKSWVCQSCLSEDHPSEKCNIITLNEELNAKKSKQIDTSKPMLKGFETTSNKSDDYYKLCEKLIKDNDEEISRYEAMVKGLEDEILKKKISSVQIKKNHAQSKHKVEMLKAKRSSYDQALTSLKSSNTIGEVLKCSMEVQKEANRMQLISTEMENEVDRMLQAVRIAVEPRIGFSLGNHKLSVRDGKHHLHVLRGENTSKSPDYILSFSDNDAPLSTDGILTFLDFSFPGHQKPRRVYMKMLSNQARARQHLLMVIGTAGISHLGLHFLAKKGIGQRRDVLIIASYDGARAAPLLKDVTVNDGVKHVSNAAVVTGAGWNGDCNTALIAIDLQYNRKVTDSTSFALVTSGIEVLQDIFKSDKRESIKVVDCGVVLF